MWKSSMLKKQNRFPRGRKIACMIYEHLRAARADEAALDLSDLFTVSLQREDIKILI